MRETEAIMYPIKSITLGSAEFNQFNVTTDPLSSVSLPFRRSTLYGVPICFSFALGEKRGVR